MPQIALPATLIPAQVTWSLERNVAVSVNPLSQTIQRVVRGGDFWKASLSFATTFNNDAALLGSFLDQASRGDAWFYLDAYPTKRLGSWQTPNLLGNGDFSNALTSWAPAVGAASPNARRARVKNTAANTPATLTQAINTANINLPHVIVCDLFPGSVSAWTVRAWRTDNNTQIAAASYIADGRIILPFTPVTATSRVDLLCNSNGATDYAQFARVSAARCLTVNGAAQQGNLLKVSGGPASVNGAIAAGEMVTIQLPSGFQLVRLTNDLDTDAAGNGELWFEPTLRASPANAAPIVVNAPFCKMLLPAAKSATSLSGPMRYGYSFDGQEDVT